MPHFGAKIEEVSFRSLLIPTVGKAINLHHHWRSSFPSKYLILAPKTSGYLSTRSHPRVSFWRQNRRSVFPLAPYTYHGTGNLTVKFPFEVSYFGAKSSGYLSARSHPRVSFWRQNRRGVFPLAPYTTVGKAINLHHHWRSSFPSKYHHFGAKVERISLRPLPSTCLILAPKSKKCLPLAPYTYHRKGN